MSRLKLNLLASLAGTGWSALMQLAFIPLYIRFMGIEAYGLVGFYLTLQAALQVLDFGLSPTINREMARYSVRPDKAAEARDLVRTLEVGYWAIGIAIGAVMFAVSPFVATRWIRASAIPTGVVQQTVMSMAVLSALQWPLTFYQGGLLGLQRQALLNGLGIIISTLRGGGALLVLWLLSPTITAFFAWQVVVAAVHIFLITLLLWRSLPPSCRPPRFDFSLIRNIRRFATGMSVVTLSALVLMQTDKLILSRLLSLRMFGYYTLAGVVASGIALIVSPVFNVVFPRLSALVAEGYLVAIKQFYHRGAQLMTVIVWPVAAWLAFFSKDILLVWTGSAETVSNAAQITSLLVLGSALNSIMVLPYALQLAYGWTSIVVRINALLILLLVPAIFILATALGAVGAAWAWVALNGVYLAIGAPQTFRRLLPGEGARWFVQDVAAPLGVAVVVVFLERRLLTGQMPIWQLLPSLLAALAVALLATALASSHLREWVVARVPRRRFVSGRPPLG